MVVCVCLSLSLFLFLSSFLPVPVPVSVLVVCSAPSPPLNVLICEPLCRAVGCIFGELLLRKPLIPGANELDQLRRMFDLIGMPTEECWPDLLSLPLARVMCNPSCSSRGTLFSKLPHLSPNVSFSVALCADVHDCLL